jgi:hypothetical protein
LTDSLLGQVTHQLQYIKSEKCDLVLVLDEGGYVRASE